ncbi:CRISPR-associated helicase Cas3' [bacterium]|nr:CRISPR-associated helicase Cas3' [bacterium]
MAPNEQEYFAHSIEGRPPEKWQPLEEHLKNVAELAAEFARPFGGQEWAYLAGLWHDLGKASKAFQAYLRHENQIEDFFSSHYKGKVDHSTFGGQYAQKTSRDAGKLLAYVLTGHHTGLLNWLQDAQHGLQYRLGKKVEPIHIEPLSKEIPGINFLKVDQDRIGFQLQFFVRMIYSCLVDADFLDTEKFINPEKWRFRNPQSNIIEQHQQYFWTKLKTFQENTDPTNVNKIRDSILSDCMHAAEKEPGIFSLTVPTGGGKTISSMAFALKHAKKYNKKRIIYVIPFTSIIEQNVKVFREMIGEEAVLEHHSNFEPDEKDWKNKLSTENWAAPIVVTTNVQFFNSFFANKTSRCRKLHHIANSVIIFDEVQAIPVEKLKPCLEVIRELVLNYGVSTILCTATQPALNKTNEFAFGLSDVREIVTQVGQTFEVLRRTEVTFLGKQNETDIAEKMMSEKRALCVVSTRKQARDIFNQLDGEGAYHLSALMYPMHRSRVLAEIKDRLKNNETNVCRVVSTQLIEAGVDVDFPIVFRALAGMDSIAQAAGRCNREGKLEVGNVYVFEPESGIPPGYFRQTAQCAQQLLNRFEGRLLEPDCIHEYFLNYYWLNQDRMDESNVVEKCRSAHRGNIQFEDLAEFQMIRSATIPIIIAIEEEAKQLLNRLNYMDHPSHILRKLQKYSVQVYPVELKQMNGYLGDAYAGINVLQDSDLYSQKLGLIVNAGNRSQENFIV